MISRLLRDVEALFLLTSRFEVLPRSFAASRKRRELPSLLLHDLLDIPEHVLLASPLFPMVPVDSQRGRGFKGMFASIV